MSDFYSAPVGEDNAKDNQYRGRFDQYWGTDEEPERSPMEAASENFDLTPNDKDLYSGNPQSEATSLWRVISFQDVWCDSCHDNMYLQYCYAVSKDRGYAQGEYSNLELGDIAQVYLRLPVFVGDFVYILSRVSDARCDSCGNNNPGAQDFYGIFSSRDAAEEYAREKGLSDFIVEEQDLVH